MARAAVVQKSEELVGEIERVVWSSPDGDYSIARLTSKVGIKGCPPRGGLIAGLSYRFIGEWQDDPKYGRQFAFRAAVEHEPSGRDGVVEFLSRYADGIGYATAHAICDKFGAQNAIAQLKSNPKGTAAAVRGLSESVAIDAAVSLREAERFQETRIKLIELIAGRGFGEKAIDACIEKWGAHAPDVIRHDPFKMMVARIFGAGYLRCDRLWCEFGLPPDRMRRQVMAAWEHLRSDMSGSTWHAKSEVIDNVKRLVTGNARPERAVAIAIRAGVFVQCDREGVLWLSERKKAEDESYIARRLRRLMDVE